MKRCSYPVGLILLILPLIFVGCETAGNKEPTPTVVAPTFSPASGTYSAAQDITIATTTPSASIRYTTNGTTPTATSGTLYSGPVHISDTLTLKAVAYRSGWTTSSLASGQFTIKLPVAAPEFNPAPGSFTAAQDISITSATAGAITRYTTDGSTPTETNGTLYSAPVHLEETATLKAVAYLAGWTTSSVTSGQYTIEHLVSSPEFNPVPGIFVWPQEVVITTLTAGATIRYTTDGSTPSDTNGIPYSTPVNITETLTLKAVAYRLGWTTSAVTSGQFTIEPPVDDPEFTPAPGTYTAAQDVTITTTTAGAIVRYTTDGSIPTETSGAVYAGPVQIADTLTLKAIAYRGGWTTSQVISGQYAIEPLVVVPELSPAPGAFAVAQDITITTTTAGTIIRYTTDGSTPNETTGTVYTTPIHITGTVTLKAVAYKTGWTTSPIIIGEYKRVSVSAGTYHTLLTRGDGTVWAWGGNYEGQIGDGTTTSHPTPAQVPGISGIVAVSAGLYHSVALKSDGTVWAWGRNIYGQLGDGTTTSRLTPVQVLEISGVTAVVASECNTYALKSDGTVWAWGRNNDGQVGDGTTIDRLSPVQVPGLSEVVEIGSGLAHAVALRNDGTVWAWGYNGYGSLGDGTLISRWSPVRVPSLSGLISVTADSYHTVAIMGDRTLRAWGQNFYGQLGDGNPQMACPSPVQTLSLSGAISVEAGGYFTIVLIDDGTLRSFGYNLYGWLGDGTNTNRSTPVPVLGLTGVVAVGASHHHAVAVMSNGAVWAWGHNPDYELGDGTTTDRWTPVQIIW